MRLGLVVADDVALTPAGTIVYGRDNPLLRKMTMLYRYKEKIFQSLTLTLLYFIGPYRKSLNVFNHAHYSRPIQYYYKKKKTRPNLYL